MKDSAGRAVDGGFSRVTFMLKRTWLPTALFVGAIGGGWLLFRVKTSAAALAAAPAVLIAPIVWWRCVERRQPVKPSSGAMAGGLIAPIVWVIPLATSH